MGSIADQPINQNLLQAARFQLQFDRLPYISFFVKQANIPGLATNPPEQPTIFKNIPRAANKLHVEDFAIKFMVDEPLWSWTSLHDWLCGITFPDSFEEYKNLSLQQRLQFQSINNSQPQYSDCQLMIFTNKNNPILKLNFKNMFPVSLSGITLDNDTNANYIPTAVATFQYENYYINRQV